MSTSELIFFCIGGVGLVVLLLSLVFGDHDGAGSGLTEIGGDAAGGAGTEFHAPSWFSVTAIAAGMTGFGASGFLTLIATSALLPAIGIGFAGMFGLWGITLLMSRYIARQQHNSIVYNNDYIGLQGVLSLPVSGNGIGQVDFADPNGMYTRLSAVSMDGQDLPIGTHVLIVDVTDHGAIVSPDPNFQLEE